MKTYCLKDFRDEISTLVRVWKGFKFTYKEARMYLFRRLRDGIQEGIKARPMKSTEK